jgi:hypothetical protein
MSEKTNNPPGTRPFTPSVPDLSGFRPVDKEKNTTKFQGETYTREDEKSLFLPEDDRTPKSKERPQGKPNESASSELIPVEPKHLDSAIKKATQAGISETAVAGAMGNEPYTLKSSEAKSSRDKFPPEDQVEGTPFFVADKKDEEPTPFTDYSPLKPKGEKSEDNKSPFPDDKDVEGVPFFVEGKEKSQKDKIEEGYKKIGEVFSKRVDELKSEGASDEEAYGRALDEFYRTKSEEDDGNNNPPPPPPPPGPPPGPPGPPPGPPGPEGGREIENTEQELADATAALGESIDRFAAARVEREKLFGGGNAEKMLMEREGQILQENFKKWSEAVSKDFAARADAVSETFDAQKETLRQDVEALEKQKELASSKAESLRSDLSSATDPAEVLKIQTDLLAYEALDAQTKAQIDSKIEALGRIDEQKNAELQRIEQERNELLSEALIEVEQRVNAEMLAIKEAKRPKLAKFNEWLKRKPVVRIAIGAGLAAMGVVGVVTGAVPLVALAMGGKAALAGAGGYNIARGIGERIATKNREKTNVDSIEDYVDAAGAQSNTRRKSKKAGVVAGAALAAIPIVRGVNQIVNATPDVPPTPVDYNPNADRYAGIASARPEAPGQFGTMVTEQNLPNPGLINAQEVALDTAYNRVSSSLDLGQLRNLNALLGRLSTTPGYGNGFSASAMDSLADQIRSGSTANDIIKQMGLGAPIPNL